MPRLRAVEADEKPPPRRSPRSISEALSGSERDVWAAMRKALAKRIDSGEVAPNAIGSTYRDLRELDRLIRAYDLAAREGRRSGVEYGDEAFDEAAI
jgi:hypothetical protein